MRNKIRIAIFLGILILALYFYWQTKSIYGGDAGDLVSAAYLKGVAHPPGYPLYTFLGYLLTKIPYSTVAARVGLLSVIPSALTIGILYFLILRVTKVSQGKKLSFKEVPKLSFEELANDSWRVILPALIACLTLAFSYLFWLYAEVPEVFGLHSFFVVLLTYILFIWSEKKDSRFLYLFSFVFGLSLCHHHIILFLVPAFAYWIYKHKKFLPKKKLVFSIQYSVFSILGLLPYSYVYFAAKDSPAINWNNPVNLKNFISLITRANYGTFIANASISRGFLTRFAQFFGFFETALIDFTQLGVILIFFGAFWQFKKRRKIFVFNLLAVVFGGLFFVFYASFPLINNFTLATFERFLLPSYIFMSIWLAEGIIFVSQIIVRACRELFDRLRVGFSTCPASGGAHSKNKTLPFLLFFEAVFFLLPLSLFYANFPKISILKNDFTAEHLAEDILYNLPQDSILLLMDDTVLFNSQYLYYIEKKRPDIIFIHTDILNSKDYQEQIKKLYPEIKISQNGDSSKSLFSFFEENFSGFPIYSNGLLFISEEFVWVPKGLIKRLYKKEEAPSAEEFLGQSKEFWGKLHDPFSGSLSKYKNLMLADVLRVYGWARRETGKVLLNAKIFKEGEEYFQEAIRLTPEDKENYQFLGQAFLGQKKCYGAQRSFERMVEIDQDDENGYLFLSKTYKECFKNEGKAREYERLYQEKKKEKEIPIEKL